RRRRGTRRRLGLGRPFRRFRLGGCLLRLHAPGRRQLQRRVGPRGGRGGGRPRGGRAGGRRLGLPGPPAPPRRVPSPVPAAPPLAPARRTSSPPAAAAASSPAGSSCAPAPAT